MKSVHKYHVEDTSRGVSIPVPGNIRSAKREALSICEGRKCIVNIYEVVAGQWELVGGAKP